MGAYRNRSNGLKSLKVRTYPLTMKKIAIALSLFLPMILASCGGDTYEKVAEEMQDELGGITDVLKDVKDEATAKEAIDDIKEIGANLRKLEQRAKDLPKPSKEEAEEMVKDALSGKNEMMQKGLQVAQEIQRVGKIPGTEELIKAVNDAMGQMGN